MTERDIVDRLRTAWPNSRDSREAADEIERLRATIANCPPVSESEYVRRLEAEIAARDRPIGLSEDV